METTIATASINKLIPILSEKEKEEIRAYYVVYEKYEESFAQQATEQLKDHPVFGKLIRDVPKEIVEERNRLSRALQKDAIFNENWLPFIEYQVEQGIAYAKMGLDFKAWYEIVAMVRNYLTPYLYDEYGKGEEFLSALRGMNCFMDIAMGIIGEAYLQEKESEINQLNMELEQKVIRRTAQLEGVNKELESFSYSVSHDLRAPLRAVNGYTQMLMEDHGQGLDDEAKRVMTNIMSNAKKMGQLIDDLLSFSHLGRKELTKTNIPMSNLVKAICTELSHYQNDHEVEFHINELLPAQADNTTIKQVWMNLISNAIKYSKEKDKPVVEIGSEKKDGQIVYHVKDNGAGFDMRYAGKLFGVFQRLHSADEFEGTGVGLAIVKRIVSKHGGRVWAEGKVNEGATFYFSLPVNKAA